MTTLINIVYSYHCMQVRFDKLNILAGKCSLLDFCWGSSLGDKNIPATTRNPSACSSERKLYNGCKNSLEFLHVNYFMLFEDFSSWTFTSFGIRDILIILKMEETWRVQCWHSNSIKWHQKLCFFFFVVLCWLITMEAMFNISLKTKCCALMWS